MTIITGFLAVFIVPEQLTNMYDRKGGKMGKQSFIFKGANGKDAFCWYWNSPAEPKGAVQIIHGLAEHAERYSDLAEYLNSLGFAVYASDLRGHGRTGELNRNLCDLDRDGFNGIIQDQRILSGEIRGRHPGIPLFFFAHSFGSFVAQEYIKHHGREIDGLILSSTCRMGGLSMRIAALIAAICVVSGKSRPNRLGDFLSFGSYNKRIPTPSSKFDWLSRDPEQVKKYEADPLCGFVVSNNFFYYFTKGLVRLNRNTESIPKTLPVCLISGSEDPLGQYGKGIGKLHETYKRLGISDLEFKLYPECRHELINELNRTEVFSDIGAWLLKRLSCRERMRLSAQ